MRLFIALVILLVTSSQAFAQDNTYQQQRENKYSVINGKREPDNRPITTAKNAIAKKIILDDSTGLDLDWKDTEADLSQKRWYIGGIAQRPFGGKRYFWGAIVSVSTGTPTVEHSWTELITSEDQKPTYTRYSGPDTVAQADTAAADEAEAQTMVREAERSVLRKLELLPDEKNEFYEHGIVSVTKDLRSATLRGKLLDSTGKRWSWKVDLTKPMAVWRGGEVRLSPL